MIKMNKIIVFLGALSLIILLTGCSIRRDNMEDIEIYTTNYPIEYIVDRLYGEHSTVHSIYPDGVSVDQYKLTTKQIKDYSKSDLFVFNGLSNEKDYVSEMRDNNKNLKIIDTTLSMEYTNGVEELWLDPSNFLMMAQNVKKGFKEYINNYYLNNDISNNYEELKIDASNLDAKIKQTVSNAESKTIVVASDMFKYLEKYGLTVYSLENNSNLTNKTITEVTTLINQGKISYIFTKENEDIDKVVQDIVKQTGVKSQAWHTLTNITETQRNAHQDYFDLMNENIEALKNELYS